MHSQLLQQLIPLSFQHIRLITQSQKKGKLMEGGKNIPSFAALTATKRSKFSSTSMRIASERASIEDSR